MLPAGGMFTIGKGGLLDYLHHLIAPAMVLALVTVAIWSRYMRSSMLEVIGQDYMRTARAKGLPRRVVLMRHALRNALLPMITLAGLQLPTLLGGALVTETVFTWPGHGTAVPRFHWLPRLPGGDGNARCSPPFSCLSAISPPTCFMPSTIPASASTEMLPPARPVQRRALGRGVRRFIRHRLALIGMGTILILVLACAIGPYLDPYNDLYIDILHRFAPPFSGPHLLGTDQLGRDFWRGCRWRGGFR